MLALGVLSTAKQAAAREQARPMLRAIARVDLEYRFVLGNTHADNANTSTLVHTERDVTIVQMRREGMCCIIEKVVRWFILSLDLFPNAEFVGKGDLDTVLLWPNLRPQLLYAKLFPATYVGQFG